MAGLGRRTFAAGEVLTASNVMNYLQDQAVMVFANAAARGSAVPTPSEGMVSYLADSNEIQVYNGSAWNALAFAANVPTIYDTGLYTIIPTSVNVNAGSGSITSTTGRVAFSGASTVSINGCFTSNFVNYIVAINIFTSGADQGLNVRFRNAGSDFSTAVYQCIYYETQAGASTQTYTSSLNANTARALRTSATGGSSGELTVMAPFASVYTRAFSKNQDSQFYGQSGISYNGTQSFDGFSILGTSAMSGEIRVYGLR